MVFDWILDQMKEKKPSFDLHQKSLHLPSWENGRIDQFKMSYRLENILVSMLTFFQN